MKRLTVGLLATGLALGLSSTPIEAQVHVGAGIDRSGLSYFHLALGEVYGAPLGVVPTWIHPEELPVVYLLARQARVSPQIVIALRERGWSWLDITYHLGLHPRIFVTRLPHRHGYWSRYGVRDYRYLTDRHIIDYVNLFFWADYHRHPVTQVIVLRERSPSWTYYVRQRPPARGHAPRVVRRAEPPPVARRAEPAPVRRQDAPPLREAITRPDPRRTDASPPVRGAPGREVRAVPQPERGSGPTARPVPVTAGARDRTSPAPDRATPAAAERGREPARDRAAPSRGSEPTPRASPGETRRGATSAPSRGAAGSRGESRSGSASRRGGAG